jgi:glucosamine--fructose-6-phosphate aminotransferase (isomerizing)
MIDPVRCRALIEPLLSLPRKMEQALESDELIQRIAREFMHARDFLYLGRGIQYPIALEGALKLKEISYVHAEGYPAGEMKHGPIALIDEKVPVVFLCPHNETFEKVISNMEEVRARSGRVVAVATDGHTAPLGEVDALITVPESSDEVAAILTAIPMQLLAYHIAVLKGTDVDQPRNLAKSVTVE